MGRWQAWWIRGLDLFPMWFRTRWPLRRFYWQAEELAEIKLSTAQARVKGLEDELATCKAVIELQNGAHVVCSNEGCQFTKLKEIIRALESRIPTTQA